MDGCPRWLWFFSFSVVGLMICTLQHGEGVALSGLMDCGIARMGIVSFMGPNAGPVQSPVLPFFFFLPLDVLHRYCSWLLLYTFFLYSNLLVCRWEEKVMHAWVHFIFTFSLNMFVFVFCAQICTPSLDRRLRRLCEEWVEIGLIQAAFVNEITNYLSTKYKNKRQRNF